MPASGSYEMIGRNMHMGLDTWNGGANEEPRMSMASTILLRRALVASSKASDGEAIRGGQSLEVVMSTLLVVRNVFSIV